MAERRYGEGGEAAWWERLEQRPVGTAGAIVVALGWVALALVYASGIWPLEVTFFLGVGWLTFVLCLLQAYAAVAHAIHIRRRREPPDLFRLPKRLERFEDYFRWLTPVAFIVGIVFAHFFWH